MNVARILLAMLIVAVSETAVAATYSVSGSVTDTRSGVGLVGVSVTIAGKNAMTDAAGNYTINNVPTGKHTIHASLVNYTIPDKAVKVKNGPVWYPLWATGDSRTINGIR